RAVGANRPAVTARGDILEKPPAARKANWRLFEQSTLVLGPTLAHRLEQADASGDGDVETADAAAHGQPDQVIAMLASQTAHALALGAHDQHRRTGHVELIQLLLDLTCSADHPEPLLLQFLQGARQIG